MHYHRGRPTLHRLREGRGSGGIRAGSTLETHWRRLCASNDHSSYRSTKTRLSSVMRRRAKGVVKRKPLGLDETAERDDGSVDDFTNDFQTPVNDAPNRLRRENPSPTNEELNRRCGLSATRRLAPSTPTDRCDGPERRGALRMSQHTPYC